MYCAICDKDTKQPGKSVCDKCLPKVQRIKKQLAQQETVLASAYK